MLLVNVVSNADVVVDFVVNELEPVKTWYPEVDEIALNAEERSRIPLFNEDLRDTPLVEVSSRLVLLLQPHVITLSNAIAKYNFFVFIILLLNDLL